MLDYNRIAIHLLIITAALGVGFLFGYVFAIVETKDEVERRVTYRAMLLAKQLQEQQRNYHYLP